MSRTLRLLIDQNKLPIEVDLDRLKATIAVHVHNAILTALRERISPDLPMGVMSQWDVHLDYDELSWLGGRIDWDCLIIVDEVLLKRNLPAGVSD